MAKQRTRSVVLEPKTPWGILARLEDAARDRAAFAARFLGSSAELAGLDHIGKQYATVSSGPTLEAARALVGLVERTMLLASADTAADVRWLAEQLEGRRRLHWAQAAKNGAALAQRNPKRVAEYVGIFIASLAVIDERALDLDPARVARLLVDKSITTPSGLAARLACDCKAFGYSGRPSAAKLAFAKALKNRNA